MTTDLIITVNLLGKFQRRNKHNAEQKHRVSYMNGSSEVKTITHVDSSNFQCSKVLNINESVVESWIKGDCPNWVRPTDWKRMNARRKLDAYIKTFDEGFGVSYSIGE